MIVWNHNPKDSQPIMIIAKWHAHPEGERAVFDTTYSIASGQGIDLDILGLKPEKPNSDTGLTPVEKKD